ncbi:hypothetical protein JEY40_24855 [Bradyrhizobium japonicum]|uniref:hypothetical protein n=1 Tax=Bradyrhizobium japonicum TaxID=375 RepID=UPI00200D7081|nr:hypothetical protein [Bradyrhizobium japonicum]UQD69249.1 hypothetical protein JEY40_24855 [Bradyrhizobium japonicum]WAX24512.1 hypothetical protein [Bradyrhizobium phage ppBjS10J-1]
MSFPEITCLALLAVVALQMWVIHRLIKDSLATMRSCSETTDMAVELSHRALDAASPSTSSNNRGSAE